MYNIFVMSEIPLGPSEKSMNKIYPNAVLSFQFSEMRRYKLTNLWKVPLFNIFLELYFGNYFQNQGPKF